MKEAAQADPKFKVRTRVVEVELFSRWVEDARAAELLHLRATTCYNMLRQVTSSYKSAACCCKTGALPSSELKAMITGSEYDHTIPHA